MQRKVSFPHSVASFLSTRFQHVHREVSEVQSSDALTVWASFQGTLEAPQRSLL